MPKTVDAWISEAPDDQKTQLTQLRGIIQSVAPEAEEVLKWGQPCYKLNGLFCYLQRAKSHVTLGFQKGSSLSDPHGALIGDGKQMRHVKYRSGEEIDASVASDLIAEAIRLDRD